VVARLTPATFQSTVVSAVSMENGLMIYPDEPGFQVFCVVAPFQFMELLRGIGTIIPGTGVAKNFIDNCWTTRAHVRRTYAS
jgi:hypothetical protein